MNIDIKLLKECPILTERERELLLRVDVKGEKLSDVARSLDISKSTASIQLKHGRQKLTEWIEDREKQKKTSIEEDFDKEIFRLFDKGLGPIDVIKKKGHAKRVEESWAKYCQFRDDDYQMARNKVAEAGWEIDEDAQYPLTEQIGNIVGERDSAYSEKEQVLEKLRDAGVNCNPKEFDVYGSALDAVKIVVDSIFKIAQENVTIGQQLNAYKQSVETLRLQNSSKDKQIETLQRENAELSKLKKYEDLTDEQIQQRRETIEELDNQRREIMRKHENEREQHRLSKTILEGEINALSQTKTELETDILGLISRWIAKLQFDDLVRLWTNAVKLNLWTALIAQ